MLKIITTEVDLVQASFFMNFYLPSHDKEKRGTDEWSSFHPNL